MFSYKAAVAVQQLGYTNIKIYNGGIKDWKKAGLPLESTHVLPETKVAFIEPDTLEAILSSTPENCTGTDGIPLLTLLDFRNENFLNKGTPPPKIETGCKTISLLMDDIRLEDMRARIPKDGLVVTVSETGNRDAYLIRYLSQFGFTNVKGLHFGMRGWIKLGYPLESGVAGR